MSCRHRLSTSDSGRIQRTFLGYRTFYCRDKKTFQPAPIHSMHS